MGGPKVFVVATLASSRPASPFAFRNYELPDEATPIAEQLSACAGSCKHHVWEVGGTGWPALHSGTQRAQHDGRRADIRVVGDRGALIQFVLASPDCPQHVWCLHVNICNVPAQSSRRALFVIMFITLSVVGTQLSRAAQRGC